MVFLGLAKGMGSGVEVWGWNRLLPARVVFLGDNREGSRKNGAIWAKEKGSVEMVFLKPAATGEGKVDEERVLPAGERKGEGKG